MSNGSECGIMIALQEIQPDFPVECRRKGEIYETFFWNMGDVAADFSDCCIDGKYSAGTW